MLNPDVLTFFNTLCDCKVMKYDRATGEYIHGHNRMTVEQCDGKNTVIIQNRNIRMRYICCMNYKPETDQIEVLCSHRVIHMEPHYYEGVVIL